MLHSSISRRFLVVAPAATPSTGIGVGAGSAWGASAPPAPHTQPAAATDPASPIAVAPGQDTATAASASSRPTFDQAAAVANQASPGTVIRVGLDDELTGPVYDVKARHVNGTKTKVEVDVTTGHVVRIRNQDQRDRT